MRALLIPIVASLTWVALDVRPAAAQVGGIREVTATDRNVIPLNTRLRYTTMIVLPDGDEILDVICGDRDFWVISAVQNVAHVKPAKADAETNLNLVTAKGAIYSFLLKEKAGSGQPDLKIYVNANQDAPTGHQKYYSAADVERLNSELTEAKAAVVRSEQRAKEALAAANQDYPSKLRFAYGTPKYEKPFFVQAIWHDGAFTFLKADARELPALYELKDGKPSIVNFQVRGGVYVIPKVLDRGYLALGSTRLSFEQREQ
ncbi:MAG: TrbG/VirB9 family P-type conjugative transfer protein [Acidobacteriota bacterium]|nr:TrbG/VirB9 family P-type conjugative transfer protein [Acidobacteriota bacterium]